MLKFKKSEIQEVAMRITHNSEIFGDGEDKNMNETLVGILRNYRMGFVSHEETVCQIRFAYFDAGLNCTESMAETLIEDEGKGHQITIENVLGLWLDNSQLDYIKENWYAFWNNPTKYKNTGILDLVLKDLGIEVVEFDD